MFPDLCSAIAGSTALVTMATEFRFTLMISYQVSKGMSISLISLEIPALFTRMSMVPCSLTTESTISCTCLGSVTSATR